MSFPPHYVFTGPYSPGSLKPAEYLHIPGTPPIKGWFQSGVRRRNVKPYYHLVWPKDKERGTLGRLKDILQGKGPDIHLSISAQKMDYMVNRPSKSAWSAWQALDPAMWPGPNMRPGQYTFNGPCWVENAKVLGRDGAKKYNFYTRKYEDPHPYMWTDVVWQGPHKNSRLPDQYRDVAGNWWQDVIWDPSDPGQNMNNI